MQQPARNSHSDFDSLVEVLSRPEALPSHAERVEVVRTKSSVLFFADSHVYKLRGRALAPYSVEDRRRECEEDLRLNRRISPGMFLGVRPITCDAQERILLDGRGEAIDWVVEMTRLPSDGMLDQRIVGDQLDAAALRKISTEIVRFHDRATTDPRVNEHGLPSAVSARVSESLAQLERRSGPEIAPAHIWPFLRERMARFMGKERELFERRVAHWRIREGHGDLRATKICLAGDGVFVFGADRDPWLRCGDVAHDLAALAMDLEWRGRSEAAEELVSVYASIAGDSDLERLIGFYKVQRTLLRAACELADADRRSTPSSAARGLVELAAGYARAIA